LSVRQLVSTVRASQSDAVTTLLIGSAIALGVMSVISLALGWWIAGRVLRPVHRITDTARRLSEQTLHNRINLEGPRDELKELADTFDAMLARLDQAFTSQRRFVANASHELRTPLATERVLIDEALAGRASPQEMRAILEQLRTNSVETEQLIDALLILARSGRDIEQWSAVDLAEIGDTASERASIEAAAAAIDVQTDLDPAPVVGEPGLLERLTGNLVENGIRHNQPGGWVTITTATAGDQAYVEVANSGPVVDPAATAGLIEPFRRSGADRSSRDGFGLGLSIVHAIVSAHGGQIGITARPEGGLVVRASFPVAARV
jgi:signal transduction histidine kinase